MTSLVYIRVSSDDQIKGTSLSTQESDCRVCAQRSGYEEILDVIPDEGESAKTAARPGLMRLIERVRQGGIDAVIVWKLDRLARNATDGLAIRAELRKHGCRLISATETSGEDPVGELVTTVLFAAAQFDNEVRSQRSKRAMQAIAQAGGWTFRAPAGYLLAKRDSQKDLPVLIPDPKTAPAIRLALSGAADGSLSLTEARRLMTQAGVSSTSASDAFRSPVYGGMLCSRSTGGREVRAAFPGLVDASVWRMARQAARKPCRHAKPGKGAFPLAGVAVCGVCGSPVRGFLARNAHGLHYGYYDCRKGCVRAKPDICHKNLEQILGVRWAADITRLRKAVAQEAASQADAVRELRDAASRKRSDAESRLSRLADGYADGVIDSTIYAKKSFEYREQISKAALDTGIAQDGIDALLNGLDAIVASMSDPMTLWKRLDLHGRRKFVAAFGVRLVIAKNGTCQTRKIFNTGAGETTLSDSRFPNGTP